MTDSTITVAAPPTTAALTSQTLSLLAARSGVLTDYNQGSQIRTIMESVGAVVEQQGIADQTRAFQALVYSAMSLFGVVPAAAVPATVTVTFSTARSGSPPPATQNVPIPAGTLVQTNGGIQFQTTTAVTLASGDTSIDVEAIAVVAGLAGNIPASAITTLISALIYPLFPTNADAAINGADAQSSAVAMAEFTAAVEAIGLSSPVAIANAAIAVASGSEVVRYSTVFEPWIAAGSGAGSGTAGYILLIDNGNGTASSGLIAAVDEKLRGGTTTSGLSNASGAIGYRDAGVPYSIVAVTPTIAVVAVSGTVVSSADSDVVSGAIASAVSGYFTLPFGRAAEQATIAAAVANAALGQLSSLTVTLMQSGSATPLTALTPPVSGRVLLGSLLQTLTSG